MPAGDGPDAPRIAFRYVADEEDGDEFEIRYVVPEPDEPLARNPLRVFTRHLSPTVSGIQRGPRGCLRAPQGRDGRRWPWQASRELNVASAMRNLHETIRVAVEARHAALNVWLSGATVSEYVADGWMVTEQGLEVREHGLVTQPGDLRLAATTHSPTMDWPAAAPVVTDAGL